MNNVIKHAIAAIAVAVSVGASLPANANRTIFDGIADSAPRSVFDQLGDSAPRSIFDQIQDTAPKKPNPFQEIGDNVS